MTHDIFRKQYLDLTKEQTDLISEIKEKSEYLMTLIDSIGLHREAALAKTKLEECVMWAVKGITRI